MEKSAIFKRASKLAGLGLAALVGLNALVLPIQRNIEESDSKNTIICREQYLGQKLIPLKKQLIKAYNAFESDADRRRVASYNVDYGVGEILTEKDRILGQYGCRADWQINLNEMRPEGIISPKFGQISCSPAPEPSYEPERGVWIKGKYYESEEADRILGYGEYTFR